MSVPKPSDVEKLLPEHFAADEMSLLVFGPGHGEAMVVILPDGSLGVIDGCREPPGDPVEEFVGAWLSAAPGRRISFVGLTHPHEDHYRGLGRLIEKHDRSIDRLWRTPLTDGLWARAYLQYAEYCEQNSDQVPVADDLAGLERVIGVLEGKGARLDVLAANKVMLRTRVDGRLVSVVSLAPSVNDTDRALRQLFEAMRKQVRVRQDPNLTSAALMVTWGDARLLLGGDLVCEHGEFEGWTAAAQHVRRPVQVVKASHHASGQALHWEILRDVESKLTIVTPFRQAISSQPPRPEGIQQLLGLGQAVAITSTPQWVQGGARGPRPVASPQLQARRGRRGRQRNPALTITPVLPATNHAVGVSLRADGTITRVLLAGDASFYE